MKTNNFVLSFAGFAIIAVTSMLLLFENSTMQANAINIPEYPTFDSVSGERFLAREPCKYIEMDEFLQLKYFDCEKLGRLECRKAQSIENKFRGDAYLPTMNCIKQCVRDVQAQCEHSAATADYEGKR